MILCLQLENNVIMHQKTKPIILCFLPNYLPGFRSGGPVRTIKNFVDSFGDEFDIRIVTRDRDALDKEPYSDVKVDGWNNVGKAKVFYASPGSLTLRGVARLLRSTKHDILYLNSYFAFSFTGLALLARYFKLAPKYPCIIAPRGEFSEEALKIKSGKKRVYMFVAKLIGLYRNLRWQVSSERESLDLKEQYGMQAHQIFIAPDIHSPASFDKSNSDVRLQGGEGPIKILFLSRISPMKNLDFLLEAISSVQTPLRLSIVGPVRDEDYWALCKRLIEKIPNFHDVEYLGELHPSKVNEVFLQHDLLALPTRGENFGHVIIEALTAGTPVLLSDQTFWPGTANGALEILPIDNIDIWVSAIEQRAKLPRTILQLHRDNAKLYAKEYYDMSTVAEKNRQLFLSIVKN